MSRVGLRWRGVRGGWYAGLDGEDLPSLADEEDVGAEPELLTAGSGAPVAGVTLEAAAAPAFLRTQPDLFDLPLAPPAAEILEVGPGATPVHKVVAQTWNRYGGLLSGLADRVGIDPGVAVAVLTIEASGRVFAGDGRMIIRFENHIFFNRWGAQHADLFARHFRFNPEPSRRWQGHGWRPVEGEAWREFHGDQRAEWDVFAFASSLSSRDARFSISMGAPQIMGFNHRGIGYPTVEEMFDGFSTSAHCQIIGFFDFVRGPDGRSKRLRALQGQDFRTFAALYNGPARAAVYAGRLEGALSAYQTLRAGHTPPDPAALA